MLVACLLLCLAQYPIDPVRSAQALQMLSNARAEAAKPPEPARSAVPKAEFERRWDALVNALREFTMEYNKSAGRVWPAKKADDVKKAIRQLEKTQAWHGAKLLDSRD